MADTEFEKMEIKSDQISIRRQNILYIYQMLRFLLFLKSKSPLFFIIYDLHRISSMRYSELAKK